MTIFLRRFILACLPLLALCASAHAAALSFDQQAGQRIRQQFGAGGSAAPIIFCRECVYDQEAADEFYRSRDYLPAWSENGSPNGKARELLAAIAASRDEGLQPEHYHLASLEEMLGNLGEQPTVELAASLDLLLTDAFLVLGSHSLNGRINPATIDPEWRTKGRAGNLVASLKHALGEGSVSEELAKLLPKHPIYTGLRSALARYRRIAEGGDWPSVAAGPTLHPGDRGERVRQVRRRLDVEYGKEKLAGPEDLFDADLVRRLRLFQRCYGLDDDAVVGPNTLAALNVPISARLRQIELNLERWRWLPQELGRRSLIVNIAAFELALMEGDTQQLAMRVVVGRPYRRTPVFSGTISSIVLNPAWEVPVSIAVKDLIPKAKKNWRFFAENGYRLFSGWGEHAYEVDPAGVDWSRVSEKHFPYRLRQDPGPQNALGRLKFLFPNPHDVYLHDTPSRSLFAKDSRTFSSGCIRLEKPIELAVALLRDTAIDSREKLDAALASGITRTILLKERIPLHLLYWTAWAEEDGSVHFRNDIYERDSRLLEAMDKKPPQAR